MYTSLLNRMIHTIQGGGLKERLFFMHMPKCGGTSVDSALRQCYITLDKRKDRDLVRYDSRASEKAASILFGYDYARGSHEDREILDFSERFLAYHMSRPATRYISGHISFNELVYREFSSRYRYVTILRDPIKRFTSAYFYAKYRESDHWRVEEELPEFLSTERGRSIGYGYVKFLCGSKETVDFTDREMIERAKANLRKFDLVGTLEDLETFVASFEHRFGARPRIRRKNVSPAGDSYVDQNIGDDVYDRLLEVCGPDLEVYEHAKAIMSSR